MKKLRKILKSAAITLCVLGAASTLALALVLEPRFALKGAPRLDPACLNRTETCITIIGENGEPISPPVYDKGRIHVSLDELPAFTAAAFVAVEDKRFYSHRGMDPLRMLAAAARNLKSRSFDEGASTITQQLVKNTHLSGEKTLRRKIYEIRIARELERTHSKREILEAYLNILYFGNNVYGIGSAANYLFGKSAASLTLSESALLAAIINNPAAYDPLKNRDKAISRRNTVLARMLEQGFITENEYAAAIDEEIAIKGGRSPADQYQCGALAETARVLGLDESELFGGNYRISTYLDEEINDFVRATVADYSDEDADINVLVGENRSGHMIAAAGNSPFDLALSRRMPGSTIKPFLCYAPAIEDGTVYTVTPILDAPASFDGWSPSAYRDTFFGWTSVEESLVRSMNVPAVKLLEMNGVTHAKKVAERFGLRFARGDNGLALALGGMVEGCTLGELCSAYMTLARGGKYIESSFVRSVTDDTGEEIYSARPARSVRAASEDCAYLITDVLKKCAARGTARQVGYAAVHAAAKTGTVGSEAGNSDAYCIAYTPGYTVAVWVGAREGLMSNSYSGGTLPSVIARRILARLGDSGDFPVPDSIVGLDLDARELTANKKVLLAGDGVKEKDRTRALFSSRHRPTVYSRPQTFVERESPLDDFTNFKIIEKN